MVGAGRRTLPAVAVLVLAASIFAPVRAATPRARLDRQTVGLDETLTLTLQVSGQWSGADPDLSPLDPDFKVLDTSRNSQMSFVNGRMDSHTEWTVTLAPRRTGELRIPPIALAGGKTQPLTVNVVPARAGKPAGTAPDVFIEVQAKPRHPYVQEQVTYSVRLYHAVDIDNGSLTAPKAQNALIKRLGDDVQYQTERNGRRYSVTERRYAIFPQASGTLALPAPEFTGEGPAAAPSSPFGGAFGAAQGLFGPDPFHVFQSSRPLHARGPALTLYVEPPPAAAGGSDWLPAQSLVLKESWSGDPAHARVGDALTRTVTIIARGLTGAQLPDLSLPAQDGLKVYPDQPHAETHSQGVILVGKRVQKLAVVPTRTGSFSLPALHVRWWNTDADRMQTATLPARSITVVAAPGGSPAAASPAAASPSSAREPATAPAAPKTSAAREGAPGASPSVPRGAGSSPDEGTRKDAGARSAPRGLPWAWVAAGLLLVWAATVVLWLRERRRRGQGSRAPAPETAGDGRSASPTSALRALDRACRDADPRAAARALSEWARVRWGGGAPRTLLGIARRLGDTDARLAVEELDRLMYAPAGAASWNGEGFLQRLRPGLAPGHGGGGAPEGAGDAALPALYSR